MLFIMEDHGSDKNRYVCETCGKSFSHQSSLSSHKREKHQGNLFVCDICESAKRPSSFSTKRNLDRHKANFHEGSFACRSCPEVFENKYELDDHETVEHSNSSRAIKMRMLRKRKFQDPSTGKIFPSKKTLQAHFDRQNFKIPTDDYQPDTSKCPYCGKALDSRTEFLEHLTQSHKSDVSLVDVVEAEDGGGAVEALLRAYVRQWTGGAGGEEVQTAEGPEIIEAEQLHAALGQLIQRRPQDFCTGAASERSLSRLGGRLVETTAEFRLNELGRAAAAFGHPLTLLRAALLQQLRRRSASLSITNGTRLQFTLESSGSLSWPITSPFYRCGACDEEEMAEMADVFLAYVSSVFTSQQGLFLDDGLRLTLLTLGSRPDPQTQPSDEAVDKGQGEGPAKLFGASNFFLNSNASDHSYLLRKQDFCCFVPQSTVWDNDCALSSLHLAILQKENPKNYPKMEEFQALALSPKLQDGVRFRAHMIERFYPGIDWAKPQPIHTLAVIQKYLDLYDYQLIVYNGVDLKKPIFKGAPSRDLKRQISFIYLSGKPVGHLCLVTNVERLFNARFCQGCLRIFAKKSRHNFEICDGHVKTCSICRTRECFSEQARARASPLPPPPTPKICPDCNGCFPSQFCFRMHRSATPSSSESKNQKLPICDFYVHCSVCGLRSLRSDEREHRCLVATCRHCRETYSTKEGRPHYCSIQKAKLKELGVSLSHAQAMGILPLKEGQPRVLNDPPSLETLGQRYVDVVGHTGLVFFDLETRERPDGELVPFACVAYFMCSKCCFKDFDQPSLWLTEYPCCGKRIRNYVGLQEISSFVATLFFSLNHLKKVHAFAFNGSGFDFVFLLDILVSNGRTPTVKMKGRRILHLEMGKVVLKDLLAYIPTNLASLPKTFKFEDKVLKGFFPHKLSNVVDNGFESEAWPDEKFYEPAKLRSDAERAELRAFLAAKAGQKFNFMEECLLYCSDDVLILALAVLALERTTLSETAFHISFVHSSTFTVAGLASIYYRHLFMRPKSIGLFPVHGYANLTNVQSLAAEIYFRWLNEGRRREGKEEIRYSKSSIYGEHKMANLRVDGVTSTEMWEYDSCFHHASPCCYQGRMTQKHPLYKIPYSQVHYMDIVRKLRISNASPDKKLNVIQHCDVEKLLKADNDFHSFYEKERALSQTMRHIDVRDALFGGRVENFAKVVELSPSEIDRGVRIKHVDVVSEYPFVQFTKIFPSKLHPTIVQSSSLPREGENMTLDEVKMYFGLFSVFIVPPCDVMFPTVPFRALGKTLYGLCASCMRAGEQKLCRHYADEERGWHTTLNSPDLEQALSDGFRVLRCYEVLDWGADHTTTDLFADNIRHLIKQKTQSKDGAECIGADERAAMVEAWARIGVRLDPDGWRGNAAIYQFYKILLNSLWGKLAQRQVKKQTQFLKTWDELEAVLDNETVKLTSVQTTGSDVVVCQTEDVGRHSAEDPTFYNPFIATLVASYARLHISSFMGGLGFGNPYYCDTDSLIYKSDPGRTNDPDEDPHKVLGSLTSELPPGTFIKKLVILAPKCYAYDVYSEAEPYASSPLYSVLKMKGISLRERVKSRLTTRVLEGLALSSLSAQDAADFYADIAAPSDAEPTRPGPPSNAQDQRPTALSLPQPRLTKSRQRFAIFANPRYEKILSASFSKRLLCHSVVFQDMNSSRHSDDPFHPSHYPSIPFGYQASYFGNHL